MIGALIISSFRVRNKRLDMIDHIEIESVELDYWMWKRMKDKEVSVMNTENIVIDSF